MSPRHRGGAARKANAKQHQANNNEQPFPSREVSTQNGTTACEDEDAPPFGEVSKDMKVEKAQQTPQKKRANDTLENTSDAKGLHTFQDKAEENIQVKERQSEQEEEAEEFPNDKVNAKTEKSADEQEAKTANDEKDSKTTNDEEGSKTINEEENVNSEKLADEKDSKTVDEEDGKTANGENDERTANGEVNAKSGKPNAEKDSKTVTDEKDNVTVNDENDNVTVNDEDSKTVNDEKDNITANDDENAKSEKPADEKNGKIAHEEFAKAEKPADEHEDKAANDEGDGKADNVEKDSKLESFGDEHESKTNVKGSDDDEGEMANANLLEDEKAEERADELQEQEAEKAEEETEKFVAAEVVGEENEAETKTTEEHNARDEQEVGIHLEETDRRHKEVQQSMAAAEEQEQKQEEQKQEDKEVKVAEEKQEIQIEESSESFPEWAASEVEFSVAPSEESTGFCCVKDISGNACEEMFVSRDGLCGPRERSRVFNEARHMVLDRIPAAIVRYTEEAQSESVADACLSCSSDMSESCFPATKLFAEMLLASGAAAMSFLYQYRKEIAKGVACLATNTFKCFKTCLCTVTPPPQEARVVQRGSSGRWMAVDYPTDQWSPCEYAEMTVLPNVHFQQSPQPTSGLPRTPSLCSQASLEVLQQEPQETLQQQPPQETLQQRFCAVSPGQKHAPFMRRVPSNH